MSDSMVFRHVVGKSTLKEGITVHKDFEQWFEAPESGTKKEITLIFDKGKKTSVILRTLNNRGRHAQIKYETTRHSEFRQWLQSVFEKSAEQTVG